MKIKCICFCTYLHENAKKTQKNENAKNENVKERKKKTKTQINAKKTKTHLFKNEDAYFQERRRKKRKTQIRGERCQLSSGEYCNLVLMFLVKQRFPNIGSTITISDFHIGLNINIYRKR